MKEGDVVNGMYHFAIYDEVTGEVVMNGVGDDDGIAQNVEEGQKVYKGKAKKGIDVIDVKTGKIKVPEEPTEEEVTVEA